MIQNRKTSLSYSLSQFEMVESNLIKLERLWQKIEGMLPTGPRFGSPPEYDECRIAFRKILGGLPPIDGFFVKDNLHDFDEVGQMWFDAMEIGEIEAQVNVTKTLAEQGRQLQEYRYHFQAKRRELIRERLKERIHELDWVLSKFDTKVQGDEVNTVNMIDALNQILESVGEIDTLLGSSTRPVQWSAIQFKQHNISDIQAIREFIMEAVRAWPSVRDFLNNELYGENDPVPIAIGDLGDIVNECPIGSVTMKLEWSNLTDEDFEHLVYKLLSEADGYENVQWLQNTCAPDRGRDLSTDRVHPDALGGVRRLRTIIQCKHWQSRSVGRSEVGNARDAMELWQPPRVDCLIIVTSGRFTADAVALVEKHNQSDSALNIEMWPESHLESLLSARPHLIGEFGLRKTNHG